MHSLSNMTIAIRLLAAALIGAIIGMERESQNKVVGLRTNIIVSLSSAIITIIQLETSFFVIQMITNNPELNQVLTTDFARITAQIVSGIGFLGAGAIFTNQMDRVTGFTTAATIWAVSGLGIGVGMGYYFLSFFGTLLIYSVLSLLRKITKPGYKYNISIKMLDHNCAKEVRDLFMDRRLTFNNEDYSLEEGYDHKQSIYTYTYSIHTFTELNTSKLFDDLTSISDDIVGIYFND